MKKKILLILMMFLFVTNVKALTFNVDVTNIEDKGSGSLGTITKIDIPNKEVNALFEDIGAEVKFSVTVTNTGDKAGTLRSIGVTGTNDKMEYTTDLPEGGLSINGNDTNVVTITAKVKEGAVNGKTSSEIKIKYNYDEGSCPEGEILSEDESMCLCPTGKVRTDKGICEEPPKPIECKDDEVYNTTTKQCEKKVVPVVPDNPKTLDNIILVTLLFIVSGLGIYAVMFKKLKTNKQRVIFGIATGVLALGLSFTVLAGVFGIDNLLGAIVNPITKSKEIKLVVNEEIDLIETWDGECSLDVSELTPENIFQGGSGTESDPYKIKTAEQLSCFAKSINNGTTYQDQYVKQIKDIKLNDNLNDNIVAQTTDELHPWTPAGYAYKDPDSWNLIASGFNGTYNGDNHTISGLYISASELPDRPQNHYGLFGYADSAVFKNIRLVDVYLNTPSYTGALIGLGHKTLTINNVFTYGTAVYGGGSDKAYDSAGIVGTFNGNNTSGTLRIEKSTNNMSIKVDYAGGVGGIIGRIENNGNSDEPNMILKDLINNGKLTITSYVSGAGGILGYTGSERGNYSIDNCANTVDIEFKNMNNVDHGGVGGLFGYLKTNNLTITNTHNEGDIYGFKEIAEIGGIVGSAGGNITINNAYNSGDIVSNGELSSGKTGVGGILGTAPSNITIDIRNSYNTGEFNVPSNRYVAGIIGEQNGFGASDDRIITNCYNTGNITSIEYSGGIVGKFGGKIYNSYNTGAMYSKLNRVGGLVGYGGASVYNSYNEGTITIFANGSGVGGICATGCDEIKNSYNRGDVIIEIQSGATGGIVGQGTKVTNSYNSGNIIAQGPAPASIGGISGDEGTFDHVYNKGNIIKEAVGGPLTAGGITKYGSVTNSVNTGDIKQVIDTPLTAGISMNAGGIAYYKDSRALTNNFNAGLIKIVNPDGTDYPIATDGLSHSLKNGEITSVIYGTVSEALGNKFNTNQDGKAIGDSSCSVTENTNTGTYTTEATPDILSIINGDDAFEIKEGEELPTLKVFNN